MLEYYRKLGWRMYCARYLLVALLIAFASLTVALVFGDSETSERYLLPAMVLTTWFVLSLSFAYYFAGLRLDIEQNAGWLDRLMHSVHKGFAYFLALLFSLVSLLLLYFTTTAIRVALAAG